MQHSHGRNKFHRQSEEDNHQQKWGVAVWGSCDVEEFLCGELQCWGVAVLGSCVFGELQCGGVVLWGSRGVGMLRCVGVGVCGGPSGYQTLDHCVLGVSLV